MIKIYTDGSCLGNPGAGGWAAVIVSTSRLFFTATSWSSSRSITVTDICSLLKSSAIVYPSLPAPTITTRIANHSFRNNVLQTTARDNFDLKIFSARVIIRAVNQTNLMAARCWGMSTPSLLVNKVVRRRSRPQMRLFSCLNYFRNVSNIRMV